jgi:hypothetical protein
MNENSMDISDIQDSTTGENTSMTGVYIVTESTSYL